MTDLQWNDLIAIVNGEKSSGLRAGFIIDSPWLPNWYGHQILDYFTSDAVWLSANFKALNTFPELTFLPSFWSEYGMCTEPSAFGAKSVFWKNEFPFAEKLIHNEEEIKDLQLPDPEIDGLLPFMLNRLLLNRSAIEEAGYKIRFSVSRGPLNIATFLMGTTEFLTTMMMQPELTHQLLRKITDFLKKWHEVQKSALPTIDGIMILDDIVGFIGEEEFLEFGFPYFKELYDIDASVKLFHNDADCSMSISHYPALGINLYNPGTDMSVNDMIEATKHKVTIIGNIPPRDVLAAGSPQDVKAAVEEVIKSTSDKSRLMLSCGGGMPPGVTTENIKAFIDASQQNFKF